MMIAHPLPRKLVLRTYSNVITWIKIDMITLTLADKNMITDGHKLRT